MRFLRVILSHHTSCITKKRFDNCWGILGAVFFFRNIVANAPEHFKVLILAIVICSVSDVTIHWFSVCNIIIALTILLILFPVPKLRLNPALAHHTSAHRAEGELLLKGVQWVGRDGGVFTCIVKFHFRSFCLGCGQVIYFCFTLIVDKLSISKISQSIRAASLHSLFNFLTTVNSAVNNASARHDRTAKTFQRQHIVALKQNCYCDKNLLTNYFCFLGYWHELMPCSIWLRETLEITNQFPLFKGQFYLKLSLVISPRKRTLERFNVLLLFIKTRQHSEKHHWVTIKTRLMPVYGQSCAFKALNCGNFVPPVSVYNVNKNNSKRI